MKTPSPTAVRTSLERALRGDSVLSYPEVLDVIRASFDRGKITQREREELRALAASSLSMDLRARQALRQFVEHLDKSIKLSATPPHMAIPVPIVDPGPISRLNTDLGKFSHGCFDVAYRPDDGVLQVTLKVNYLFETGIDDATQKHLKLRMIDAVERWNQSGVYLRSSDLVLNPVILIRFQLHEIGKGVHFTVDVQASDRREWVGLQLNIDQKTPTFVLAHELGHMLGNYDEYRDTGFMAWVERRMYWRDNRHLKDVRALMNQGSELRARYFDHFERFINDHFRSVKATYKVVLPAA